MLYNDNVNTTNSTIKSGVDAWYKHYLLEDYSDYLEDTVFCNDRSIDSLGGWDPNGGSLSRSMFFYRDSALSCTNDTDKFSVSNNKAKLTYKVGLMSYREMNLLNNNIRKTGQDYWLASPYVFDYEYAHEFHVYTTGGLYVNLVNHAYGARPVISLKPGIEYSDGDGSQDHPYIIDMEGD